MDVRGRSLWLKAVPLMLCVAAEVAPTCIFAAEPHLENYFDYAYPKLTSSFYTNNFPSRVFQKTLAEAHEARRAGELRQAISQYQMAMAQYEAQFRRYPLFKAPGSTIPISYEQIIRQHIAGRIAGAQGGNLLHVSNQVEYLAEGKFRFASEPVVIAGSGNSIHVFGVGREGDVVHYRSVDSQWRPTILTSVEATGARFRVDAKHGLAAITANDRQNVFGVNNKGELIYFFNDGGRWAASNVTLEASPGARLTVLGKVAVALSQPGGVLPNTTLEVFGRSGNGSLIRFWLGTKQWQAEDITRAIGGTTPASIARPPVLGLATRNSPRRVFGTAVDGSLLVFDSLGSRWVVANLTQTVSASSSSWAGFQLASDLAAEDAEGVWGLTKDGSLARYKYAAQAQKWSAFKISPVPGAAAAVGTPLVLRDGVGPRQVLVRNRLGQLIYFSSSIPDGGTSEASWVQMNVHEANGWGFDYCIADDARIRSITDIQFYVQARGCSGQLLLFNGGFGASRWMADTVFGITGDDPLVRTEARLTSNPVSVRVPDTPSGIVHSFALTDASQLQQLETDLDSGATPSLADTQPLWDSSRGQISYSSARNLFSLYYYGRFVAPLSLADVYIEVGQYQDALNVLFRILYDRLFAEEVTSSDLVTFSSYGSGPIETVPIQTPPESQLSLFGQLHVIERDLVILRIAGAYQRWADSLFRQSLQDSALLPRARSNYIRVLAIYEPVWRQLIASSAPEQVKNINVLVRRLVIDADRQLSKIGAGRNFLGYADDYASVWSYDFLRTSALYFGSQAKQLQRDAITFLGSAEKEAEQQLLLSQSLQMARRALSLEQLRVAQEKVGLKVAKEGSALAAQRVENKKAELKDFKRSHPMATASEMGKFSVLGITVRTGDVATPNRWLSESLGYAGSVLGFSTSGLSQQRANQDMIRQMGREVEELEMARDVARLEVDRAALSVRVAEAGEKMAALDVSNKEANVQFAQGKLLTKEFWYRLTRETKERAERYLEHAIVLSWLTQQAYNFDEGLNLNVIRLDYMTSAGELGADQLLLDLDSIDQHRLVSKQEKGVSVVSVLSLRDRDPFALERLRNEGRTVFYTTQLDFDLANPGTYNRRIQKVDVSVLALVGPSGLSGTLRKSAFSLIKVRGVGGDVSSLYPDWPRYTQSRYRLRLMRNPDDTMVIGSVPGERTPQGEAKQLTGIRNLFEGHGVTGAWTLELPKSSNKFDYETIFDVLIKIEYTASYDSELKEVIELERRKLVALGELGQGNAVTLSARTDAPDALYWFQNPRNASATQRWLVMELAADQLPRNEIVQRLSELWIGVYGPTGLIPVNLRITSRAMNPNIKFDIRDGEPVITDIAATADSLRWYPAAGGTEAFREIAVAKTAGAGRVLVSDALAGLGARLADSWIVRIDVADNPDLADASGRAFDPAKINAIRDVVMRLRYDYLIPGLQSIPVRVWAEFEDGSSPASMQFISLDTPHKVESAPWVSISGVWRVSDGMLRQTNAVPGPNVISTSAKGGMWPQDFLLSVEAVIESATSIGLSMMGDQSSASDGYAIGITRIAAPELPPGRVAVTTSIFRNQQRTDCLDTTLSVDAAERQTIQATTRTFGVPGGPRTVRWYVNGVRVCELVDAAPLTNTERVKLITQGAASFDNLTVGDLTGYPDMQDP
jgi:hypothetical protein